MSSDNPQQQLYEPVRRKVGRYVFVPGKGMVLDLGPDDIHPDLLVDVNDAIADSEAAARSKPSHANVGYASIKRGTR
jgi:hypothetical protein